MKAVIGRAAFHHSGVKLRPADIFSGLQSGQAGALLEKLGFEIHEVQPPEASGSLFTPGELYSRTDVQKALGLAPTKGGNWATGYHRHDGQWFLFPTVGAPAQTGHNYPNQWVPEGLHWFAKTDAHANQPGLRSMLARGAIVHLFVRGNGRDKFTYMGTVTPARVIEGTVPLEVVWSISSPTPEVFPDELPGGVTYTEGARKTVTVNAYERDRAARAACIKYYGASCSICKLKFEDRYGELAQGIIHVHHIVPIASKGKAYTVDPIKDLRPVCPNCHAVLHATDPPQSIEAVITAMAQ